MDGSFAIVIVFVWALISLNAGAIAFALSTLFGRCIRWYLRLAIGTGVVVLMLLSVGSGLHVLTDVDDGSGYWTMVDALSMPVMFVAFNGISVVALVWITIWLFKRKVEGFRAALKWIAITSTVIGACITLLVLVYFCWLMSLSPSSLFGVPESNGIVAPEDPDYHNGE